MAIGWMILAGALFILLIVAALMRVVSDEDDLREEAAVTTKPLVNPDAWIKYPVPLDDGLQKYIQRKCKERDLSPALVMAVIGTESQFNPNAVGDRGNSFGLMQIYKSVHEDRMKRLGVSDLMDPYENVTVGIDILADLMDRDNGAEWALSYYSGNGGAECEYSYKVLRLAECLAEGVMVQHG